MTLKTTGTTLALALGLSGCGPDHAITHPVEAPCPGGATPSRQELQASVRRSLEQLDALQLFTVGDLVLRLPERAQECDGVPCPGDAAGQATYDAELMRQSARLAVLVQVAERCNSGHCYSSQPQSTAEALQALNALEVVRVSSLVTVEPKSQPACYNLPCPADLEEARLENERRARMAMTIATNAQGL